MKKAIRRVTLVSDGLLVEFGHGLQCYFSASFLQEQVGKGSNQVFLDFDPSPEPTFLGSSHTHPALGSTATQMFES